MTQGLIGRRRTVEQAMHACLMDMVTGRTAMRLPVEDLLERVSAADDDSWTLEEVVAHAAAVVPLRSESQRHWLLIDQKHRVLWLSENGNGLDPRE